MNVPDPSPFIAVQLGFALCLLGWMLCDMLHVRPPFITTGEFALAIAIILLRI